MTVLNQLLSRYAYWPRACPCKIPHQRFMRSAVHKHMHGITIGLGTASILCVVANCSRSNTEHIEWIMIYQISIISVPKKVKSNQKDPCMDWSCYQQEMGQTLMYMNFICNTKLSQSLCLIFSMQKQCMQFEL